MASITESSFNSGESFDLTFLLGQDLNFDESDVLTEYHTWILDKNLSVIYSSSVSEKTIGYRFNSNEKIDLEMLLSPDSMERIAKLYLIILQHPSRFINKTFNISTNLKHKNGFIVAINSKISLIGDKEGKIAEIIGISRLASKSTDLEGINLKYKRLFENLPIGIYLTTPDGKIIYCNEYLYKLLGYESFKEVSDRDLEDEYFEPVYPRSEFKKKLEEEGKILGFESQWTTKNGGELWMRENVRVLKNYEGKIVCYEGVVENITEKKINDTELKKAKELLELSYRAKSDFLSNMSHEIRTPMNAILGFAEILKEKLQFQPDVLEYTTSIQTSGENLLHLLDDILELSRMESNKADLKYLPVNIYKILDEIYKVYAFKKVRKKIEFFLNIDKSLPRYIYSDEVKIRQILMNLTGNAFKFTDHGNIQICASASNFGANKADIIFEIIDTGIGIPKDQQTQIFEPFIQSSGNNNAHFEGVGLGLSITKKLVDLFNGKIELTSEFNMGSTFKVTLPQIEISKEILSEDSESRNKEIIFEKATILYVDDNDQSRKIFKEFLAPLNIIVLEAPSGSGGLELLQTQKPNIIFMDLKMPGMNGFEACKEIRKINGMANTPIIALTAADLLDTYQNIHIAFNGYLSKPISKQRIIEEIKRFVPYKYKGDNISIDFKRFEYSTEGFDQNENLNSLKLLNTIQIKEEFINTRKSSSFKNIKRFAEIIIHLGIKNSNPFLKNLGDELKMQANVFNAVKIEQMLYDLEKYFEN